MEMKNGHHLNHATFVGAKSQISASWAVEERNWKGQLATCCASLYAEKLLESRREEADVEESELTVLLRALNMSAWGDRRWGFPVSLTYGFYQSTKLKLPSILGGLYDLPLAYLVIPIAVFIFTLLSLLWQIRSAIRVRSKWLPLPFHKIPVLLL